MNKLFAPFLPPWVETGLQPAFYDMESGTVLQQTARMYAKVQQLTRLFNELSAETRATVEEYIAKFVELKDFVDTYFENLDVQEEINNKLDAMVEDGTLAEVVGYYLGTKLNYYIVDNTWTQAEIQEKLSIEEDKIIEFKSQTYNFTDSFRLNSNTKLVLNDAVLNSTDRHLFFNFKDTDTDITGYNGSHNIEIIGGKINGAISFIHGKNLTFKDIDFYHVENDHCMEICACKNVLIENCSYEGVTTQTNDRQYVENIQLENATHTNFPWLTDETATYDNMGCENITINNCTFKQTDIITYRFYAGIGGHTYVAEYPHKNVVITNCTFTDSISFAIRLLNTEEIVVANNTMIESSVLNPDGDSVSAINFNNACKNIVVENNTFDGFTGHLYFANGSENVVVHNNIFKNLPYDADSTNNSITTRQVDTISIVNNTFVDNKGGIVYQLSQDNSTQTSQFIFNDNTITCDSTVSEIAYYRIRLYNSARAFVCNNTFDEYPADGYMVRLHSGVSEITMKGNTRANLTTKMVQANGYTGSYTNVYDIYFDAYSGNTTTITNQSMNYDYTQFNKAVLIYGDGAQCNVKEVRAFAPNNKLDTRTTLMAVCTTASDTPEKSAITFNNDENHTISLTSPTLKIRHIYFINE